MYGEAPKEYYPAACWMMLPPPVGVQASEVHKCHAELFVDSALADKAALRTAVNSAVAELSGPDAVSVLFKGLGDTTQQGGRCRALLVHVTGYVTTFCTCTSNGIALPSTLSTS